MRALPVWLPPAAAAALALAAAGCPGPEEVTDTGPSGSDTGPGTDTGPAADAGRDAPDLPPIDTGPPVPDSGLDGGLPNRAPSTFTEVVTTGFQSPTDVVSSADGVTFYFAAFTDSGEPAIFSVPGVGGTATALTPATGSGLQYPSGLALSADGNTLIIADPVADPDGDGVLGELFTLPIAGGTPTVLATTGLASPNALATDVAVSRLYVTGRTEAGVAGVFTVPLAGGAATTLATTPLVSPSGLYVDPAGVTWVADHLAEGSDGVGTVFQITGAGAVTEAASGLALGTPAGVSAAAGGGVMIVTGRNRDGAAQITSIDIPTLVAMSIALPTGFVDPAGIRTARAAGVFAMVDSEGNAIYRGQ